MKMKSTKRALLMSALAMLLCMSMLVGSTFAWFTDSVTSAGNVIKAGTLDIDLVDAAGNSMAGQMIKWVTADGRDQDKILWEPNCTYKLEEVKVVNKGSLNVKYKVMINGIEGSAKLLEAIEWTVTVGTEENVDLSAFEGTLAPGASSPAIVLQGHMKEEAGNEYQGLKAEGISITVVATQETAEFDSFDDQYDKDALYAVADGLYIDYEDNSYVALNANGLSSVAKLASADSSITSVTYVTDEGEVEAPVVRDTAAMNTELANGKTAIVLTEGTYTVGAAAGKTVTIAGTENTKVDVTSGLTYVRGANVTFEGLTIQSAPEGAGYTNGLADATYTVFNNCVIDGTLGLDYSCEFNNCEFNIAGDYYSVWTWGAGTVSFNDCTFNCDGKALLVYANVLDNGTSHQTVNINRCVFNDNGDDTITGKAAIEITDTYPANNITYDVIINSTTVNGFSVTTQNATTFGGTNLGTNVWGNKNLLTTDDLNVVIDGVDVH